MPTALDRLHARLRSSGPLQRFTLFTRTLLALGFVAPGLTKVLGAEFAPGIDPATPMGAFFEAVYGAGGYYAFVGAAQVLAGALLLSRRTALLGAVLYFPIVLNIAALTVATRFGVGTPVVTVLMTLACGWLLAWDAHRLAGIFVPAPRPGQGRAVEPAVWDLLAARPSAPLSIGRRALRSAYVFGTAGALALTLAARGLVPFGLGRAALLAVLAAVALTATGWALDRPRSARSLPPVAPAA